MDDLKVGDTVWLDVKYKNSSHFTKIQVGKPYTIISFCSRDDWSNISRLQCEDSGEYIKLNIARSYFYKVANYDSSKNVMSAVKEDMVNSPNHYSLFDGIEAIEIIAKSLTVQEFRGYCFGNLLKYRLRCGKKDNVEQELSKADKYQELFDKYKHFCRSN